VAAGLLLAVSAAGVWMMGARSQFAAADLSPADV
jgi:hypothetical protein